MPTISPVPIARFVSGNFGSLLRPAKTAIPPAAIITISERTPNSKANNMYTRILNTRTRSSFLLTDGKVIAPTRSAISIIIAANIPASIRPSDTTNKANKSPIEYNPTRSAFVGCILGLNSLFSAAKIASPTRAITTISEKAPNNSEIVKYTKAVNEIIPKSLLLIGPVTIEPMRRIASIAIAIRIPISIRPKRRTNSE
ncbi:MAG: hypothetical protein ACTSPC_12585 [Candidatus Heimdallarchaeota archaeon]